MTTDSTVILNFFMTNNLLDGVLLVSFLDGNWPVVFGGTDTKIKLAAACHFRNGFKATHFVKELTTRKSIKKT